MAIQLHLKLVYFHEQGKNRYRVWREGWAHDQFELYNVADFVTLQNTCSKFNIPLEEATDDSDT